jgi:hypothetical protein
VDTTLKANIHCLYNFHNLETELKPVENLQQELSTRKTGPIFVKSFHRNEEPRGDRRHKRCQSKDICAALTDKQRRLFHKAT